MPQKRKIIRDLLEQIDLYEGRPVARSEEEITLWRTDPAEYLTRKAQLTQPFPAHMKVRVLESIDAWQDLEERILKSLGQSRDEFLKTFEDVLDRSADDGILPPDQARNSWDMRLNSLVLNIGWPEAFMGLIPAGAPDLADRSRSAGRMMTAVFALEKMGKHTSDRISGFDETLKKLKAYYAFSSQ